ncbi:hypothetical protein [Chitinophaga barathri]|uniref:Uncharacterized protein n=1 Tax=Chitinophaga barathri TaxID=1647451 RepID=A0A3N4MQW1_9BACT|nr:hypothetical protein [Chitinophaga barathri]RPD42019.1 hypothetical protein EG028_07665 [Chitinophaga barathri]
MKHLLLKRKRLAGLFTIFATVTLLTSSCKDNPADPRAGWPKEVNIEFRVKTPTAAMIKADIIYNNATGGRTTLEDATLPFSVKFKRTVNLRDDIAISGYADVGGTMELEIRVDDKVVSSQTFQGTTLVTGATAYVFQ